MKLIGSLIGTFWYIFGLVCLFQASHYVWFVFGLIIPFIPFFYAVYHLVEKFG